MEDCRQVYRSCGGRVVASDAVMQWQPGPDAFADGSSCGLATGFRQLEQLDEAANTSANGFRLLGIFESDVIGARWRCIRLFSLIPRDLLSLTGSEGW